MSVLLDAYALIAFLADQPAAGEVEALIRRDGTAMTTVNLAEALDVLQRVQGITRERLDALTAPLFPEAVALLSVDETIARTAADLRARHYHRASAPLSLADCILLAAAGQARAVATADGPLIAAARAEQIDVIALPR